MSFFDAKTSLDITYNEAEDTVMICGVRYTGLVFRALGTAKPGTWLRIVERKDGTLTINLVNEGVERTFDAIAGVTSGRK